MTCKICGVKTAQEWTSGLCIHCDWHIGQGYTEDDIKKIIAKAKEPKTQ